MILGNELQSNKAAQKFLIDFYKQSDCKPPSKGDDPYLSYFTKSATVIMGSKEVNGEEEIAESRQNMWKNVTGRQHTVENVALVKGETLLINGIVEYELANGNSVRTPWAARAIFEDGTFQKMKFYQVYLDPTPLMAALS